MPRQLNYDRVAAILVEAAYFGDQETSKRWGITDRTIRNYRRHLSNNDKLSYIFRVKKEAFETDWAREIPAAIRGTVDYLLRATSEASPKDPDAIHSISGALKILADIGMTKAILDARLSAINRQNGAEDRPLDVKPKRLSAGEDGWSD